VKEVCVGRIVQKYGGSSVADAESIKRVARRIARTRADGHEVIIVISAMGDATDELMDLALKVSPNPKSRELDMLLTTGERQSAALLAMALADLGVEAVSYTGSQAGILTTPTHGNARIIDITPGRVVRSLEEGSVVIVAWMTRPERAPRSWSRRVRRVRSSACRTRCAPGWRR